MIILIHLSSGRQATRAFDMTLAPPPNDRLSDGPAFAGHTVVFTGRLSLLGRREARALVERLGGFAAREVTARTTLLVVGAEGFASGITRAPDDSTSPRRFEKSNKLRKAEEFNSKSPGSVKILTETEFCRLSGLPSDESLRQRYHSSRHMRELYPLVSEPRLRHLEAWGLIHSVVRTNADRYYGFTDVAVIKQVNDELREGTSFRGAVRRQLAAREGQLVLNFAAVRAEAKPAKVVALRRRVTRKINVPEVSSLRLNPDSPQMAIAARFFLEGSELDEGSDADRERARVAYRKALLLDPNLVPAIVNLANLHYAEDELVEAHALYGRALHLDEECFEAHFNLGNIHHDLGRYDEATGYYYEALRLNGGYADAHFYLAVTLEKMGRSDDAKQHWRAYRELAPEGEWVDLAREFSD